MTTRREIITNLYNNFLDEVKNEIDNQELLMLFPSLDNADLADVLLFFNGTFGYIDQYESAIRDLIYMYGINVGEEEFKRGLPIIIKFIDELKNLQK